MSSIFIVDDDAGSRQSVSQFLTNAGYPVRSIPNGRAALISLAAGTPDVVILDLSRSPNIGLELLKVIRGYLAMPTLPVIALTDDTSEPKIAPMRELGVRCYFAKPTFELSELLRCVDTIRRNSEASCCG